MISLSSYIDNLSIIKVLSFFLIVILLLTLIPMLIGIHLGSLFFKFILYGVMLVFFVYKMNSIDFGEGNSVLSSFKKESKEIFKNVNIFQILFIILTNILFVSAIFFLLSYLSSLGYLSFSSHLFGNFGSSGLDVIVLYLLSVVFLTPIIEELLFRGIFLRRFNMELDNLILAILISSVLFGICHNFGGILGAILFGICTSILYIKSRNILVPIFAHFLNNLISFILALSGIEVFICNSQIAIVLIIIFAIISNVFLFRAIFNEWPSVLI